MLTHIIDDIRGLIGRPVDFYTSPTYSGCGTCVLDPYSNTSTDSFCTTCAGIYWIPQYNVITVTGHITWGNADMLDWYSVGQQFNGDCRIQIKYTDANNDMIEITEKIVVDGKSVEIKSKILRGVPSLNRILLDCIEKEKEA